MQKLFQCFKLTLIFIEFSSKLGLNLQPVRLHERPFNVLFVVARRLVEKREGERDFQMRSRVFRAFQERRFYFFLSVLNPDIKQLSVVQFY